MLFTGFIASLIVRFHGHQAKRQRLRELQSLQDRDDAESAEDESGPIARRC